MKNFTFKKTSKYVLGKAFIFTFLSFSTTTSFAQVQNNGSVYVANTGNFFVSAGVFNFGTGGATATTKLPNTTYGTISFGPTATNSGTANAHFLNGYARLITTNQAGTLAFTNGTFLFPVGDGGIYAPASVTANNPSTITNTNSNPIDCAYYRANPATSIDDVDAATLDETVSAISTVEYWNIKGNNNAIVGLTWRSDSNLSTIVTPLSNLTIAGFDGAKWVEIPSVLSGTLSSGTITSTATVDLATYTFFTLAARGNSCAPLVASSGNTKTWTGTSWSPDAPTIADPVIISGVTNSPGSFVCNSLDMGTNDISLTDGQSIEIVNGVTGSGKIIMSSGASVVQRASGIAGPNIELTKKTANKRQFDYVYWGTPVTGNFFSQIANAQASTASLPGAFDLLYKYVSGAGGGWQVLTATETGKGFIARVKQQAPFTTPTATDFINMKFTGVANNGDVTVPITNNPAALNGGTSHVLLGNPYPSAIDADKFLVENENIDGVVYVWTSATSNPGTVTGYSQGDYLAYTKAGTTVPNPITNSFNGKIPSGQGFKVKSLASSGNVTFTNCMRLTADNLSFYRTDNNNATVEQPKDRYKLNMTGNNGVFSQILVAYLPETTLGYDRLYDAGRNSVSTAQLYSIFEGDGRKLAINARPTFFETDVVPVGISKSDTTIESFTISISNKEGIFNTDEVTVYLHDMVNNTYHNFNDGDFSFSSNATALNNRFRVVYQASTLNNPNFDSLIATAVIKDETFSIKATAQMNSVMIFDITGRHIETYQLNGALEYNHPFNHAQSVYIAKVKFEDGTMVTQKLINN